MSKQKVIIPQNFIKIDENSSVILLPNVFILEKRESDSKFDETINRIRERYEIDYPEYTTVIDSGNRKVLLVRKIRMDVFKFLAKKFGNRGFILYDGRYLTSFTSMIGDCGRIVRRFSCDDALSNTVFDSIGLTAPLLFNTAPTIWADTFLSILYGRQNYSKVLTPRIDELRTGEVPSQKSKL